MLTSATKQGVFHFSTASATAACLMWVVAARNSLGDKMYFTDNGSIYSANLDGTNIQHFSGISKAGWLALDAPRGNIYWTSGGSIRRAKLDGSNAEHVATLPNGEVFLTNGIAVDTHGSKVYWVTGRVNFDGSGLENRTCYTNCNPRDMALDVSGGLMYWADDGLDTRGVYRARLDGTERRKLSGTDSIGMAFDPTANQLYWTTDVYDQVVRRDLTTRIETTAVQIRPPDDDQRDLYGIALDVNRGHMYWAQGGPLSLPDTIWRANFDGTGWVPILTGFNIRSIALDLSALPRSGDYNGDQRVDAADYVVWRDGLATRTETHYSSWRANFGASAVLGSDTAAPFNGVPEPQAAWLCVCLFVVLTAIRRARCEKRPFEFSLDSLPASVDSLSQMRPESRTYIRQRNRCNPGISE